MLQLFCRRDCCLLTENKRAYFEKRLPFSALRCNILMAKILDAQHSIAHLVLFHREREPFGTNLKGLWSLSSHLWYHLLMDLGFEHCILRCIGPKSRCIRSDLPLDPLSIGTMC